MRDSTIVVCCAFTAILCLAVLASIPLSVEEAPLSVNGTVVQVFHPAGLTIARVRLETPIPVVFMDDVNLSSGDQVALSATLARYQGELELIANAVEREND